VQESGKRERERERERERHTHRERKRERERESACYYWQRLRVFRLYLGLAETVDIHRI